MTRRRLTLDDENRRVRSIYDAMAPRYDRAMAFAERLFLDDARQWTCGQAAGRVLEVAVGTGRNLPFYPPDVELVGVDLSTQMLAGAERQAAELGRQIDLRVADAHDLPFDDAGFDTVVATLTLCSIPDHCRAVAEMARVLKPGGRLVLVDHGASTNLMIRGLQRVLDPLTVRFEGDHLLRDPATAVRAAGLQLMSVGRFKRGVIVRIVAQR